MPSRRTDDYGRTTASNSPLCFATDRSRAHPETFRPEIRENAGCSAVWCLSRRARLGPSSARGCSQTNRTVRTDGGSFPTSSAASHGRQKRPPPRRTLRSRTSRTSPTVSHSHNAATGACNVAEGIPAYALVSSPPSEGSVSVTWKHGLPSQRALSQPEHCAADRGLDTRNYTLRRRSDGRSREPCSASW